MDKDSNDCIKGKSAKETFIFGSWKCRNLKKRRSASNVAAAYTGCNNQLEREKSPFYTKSITSNQQPQAQQYLHHQQTSSLPAANTNCSSPSAYDTYSSRTTTATMDDNNKSEYYYQHDDDHHNHHDHHRRRRLRLRNNEVTNNTIASSSSSTANNSCSNATLQRRNAISAAAAVYEQLQEHDFWCPRCSRKMEEPRLLPCLHSLCSGCVGQFMSKDYCYAISRSSRLSNVSSNLNYNLPKQYLEGCPICDFPLPKYGASVPPPHYPLQHRLVIYAVRRRLSQRAICCDSCPDEVQATQHCPTCLCNFCQDCGAEHEAEYSNNNNYNYNLDPDQQLQSSTTCDRYYSTYNHPSQQHQSNAQHQSTHQQQQQQQQHQVRPLWEAKSIRHIAVCLQHPSRPLRYLCLACQQVTCKECMWQGVHRGHASEDATTAGARAAVKLSDSLKLARALLNRLLLEYNEKVFDDDAGSKDVGNDDDDDDDDGDDDTRCERARTAFDFYRDSLPPQQRQQQQKQAIYHTRSRSTVSTTSHSRQARERIREYSRLKRARYLIDAIFIGEDLLANGSDVETLSLKRIILKRLKFLGVPIDSQQAARFNNSASKNVSNSSSNSITSHTGIFHCCTFCSSGGKKEATCACGGTMPGGYKGCGHGHPGHPGVHHWSCCGSIYRDGSCLLPRKCTYKITL